MCLCAISLSASLSRVLLRQLPPKADLMASSNAVPENVKNAVRRMLLWTDWVPGTDGHKKKLRFDAEQIRFHAEQIEIRRNLVRMHTFVGAPLSALAFRVPQLLLQAVLLRGQWEHAWTHAFQARRARGGDSAVA